MASLRAENVRLIALLDAHGIEWRRPPILPPAPTNPAGATHPSTLSTEEKIALFRRLFRGRTDVYPVRWEGKTGRSGYAPACGNEWVEGLCDKKRVKCADCANRTLLPLTDAVIYRHLSGKRTIGVYPLLPDDTCGFLAVDFDDAEWRADAAAFMDSCRELGVPAALEVSRSGSGAHVWVFFDHDLPARDARRLGTALISHTCARTRQLRLVSYDRLFPNQDSLPKGGFGNLIALPLQKAPRERGFSVFVDEAFQPFSDQWAFLAGMQRMPAEAVEATILRAVGPGHPLDVTFINEEEQSEPWRRPIATPRRLPAPQPESITLTLANQIFIPKAELSQPLMNRLIRLAAFQNPEFYKAQAMRFPVWDKPRVIGCAENHPLHISLPRGCLDPVQSLLQENAIGCKLVDERCAGEPVTLEFRGTLRLDQEAAVAAVLHHDTGVLCAPTAFGKTVTAAAIIARRGVNTLILVHRTELLKQWQARLSAFLGVGREVVGTIGGGKARATGQIDIAVMQSLARNEEEAERVADYGQVIVDECHHLSAKSFEAILKRVRARHVLGLTATPVRRDGHHPIIFMQCGPIRHTAARPEGAPRRLEVIPRWMGRTLEVPAETGIQGLFRLLAEDEDRATAIAAEVIEAFAQGRKVLVLTERTEHLEAIRARLAERMPSLFVLHGRMSRKQRTEMIVALEALPPDAPRVLLATGKLVGEGFDHPPLDTLVLAMPISWKGTLQQYAGRLHREHTTKGDVRIIDFVDGGHPALLRMWEKRQRGYRAMGYLIQAEADGVQKNGPGSN